MVIKVVNDFTYDTEDVKGVCIEDGGPLVNTPVEIHNVEVTPEERADFDTGLWGIGYCPESRHFTTWVLPPFGNRANSSVKSPLGTKIKFALDKFEEPL